MAAFSADQNWPSKKVGEAEIIKEVAIPESLDMLSREIQHTREVLAELESRLQPVLRTPPSPVPVREKNGQMISAVQVSITNSIDDVKTLRDAITVLMHSLDL